MSKGQLSDEKKTGWTYKGKEILLTRPMGRPKTGLTAMGLEKGIYPEETRIRACTLFAALGKVQEVSELADVPAKTINAWRKTQWWRDLLLEIREENNELLDAKLSEALELSLNLIIDRLKEGDFAFNKKGELVRKPVGIRDLSLVNAISVDKRQLLRGLPTSRTESVSGSNLDKLAEAFTKLANARKLNAVQESGTKEVDVREQTSDGQTVAEGNPEGQVASQESEKVA